MAPIERGLAAAGLGAKSVATAHTIGLDLSETVINPRTPGEIAAGMVVTVHPMIELGEWRQLFTGETYAVGDSGCVCLNRSEDRIYVV
jgi:Xaa-Pro aminopeptidase